MQKQRSTADVDAVEALGLEKACLPACCLEQYCCVTWQQMVEAQSMCQPYCAGQEVSEHMFKPRILS